MHFLNFFSWLIVMFSLVLKHVFSVFLASSTVSDAARLSLSQQRGEAGKRPSGLGQTVAATTRVVARTPFQIIIRVAVGRTTTAAMGTFPHYSGTLSSHAPPSFCSADLTFFTPLEILLCTWVDKSFFVLPHLSGLCLCSASLASFKKRAACLWWGNIWKKGLLLPI